MTMTDAYLGKADAARQEGPKSHLLACHCLDVAAVAVAWLDASSVLRAIALRACGWRAEDYGRLRAWIGFFVALHDLGKFHALFQWVLLKALGAASPPLDWMLDLRAAKGFHHGSAGLGLFADEYREWIGEEDEDCRRYDAWLPWMRTVTGHHGELIDPEPACGHYGSDALMARDRAARAAWVRALAELFLAPVGLTLTDLPPPCGEAAQGWFAGLCSISDWIGSNTEVSPYVESLPPLDSYFEARRQWVAQSGVLADFGLLAASRPFGGVAALLRVGESPRGVQTLVDHLPCEPGLTLIEAPTGSGKTEAALAHAWRLIEAGVAESIVFALPTQATANGMLRRAEAFGIQVFGAANVVLAHGKRDWTDGFRRLLAAARPSAQEGEEAAAQCAAWLAQSRKRVFLGQIGVCTIDQALLAVLPVRHKFVRGFGIERSVLIVDEVHAYDSYMNGLLGELLGRQRAVGGSAILLSATLPSRLRGDLLATWKTPGGGAAAPYPVVWHAGDGELLSLEVTPAQRPEPRCVAVERVRLTDANPDDALVTRLLDAARAGARVGVVLNRVDAVQALARRLRQAGGDVAVDVFHSRYRYRDRQVKEDAVLRHYGRDSQEGGRILVASQVIEQSLDLDFDWLVTQICPVDLLFQRLGRLHRHDRRRPPGFESPRCTVVTVPDEDYGVHALIYGNTRVLWRTDGLLAAATEIVFPEAYREWIEKVYHDVAWESEPVRIIGEYLAWRDEERGRAAEARRRARESIKAFRDSEDVVGSLTRDNEMSLTVLPLTIDGRTLEGEAWAALDDREQGEIASLNGIPVPATKRWKRALANRLDDEDRYRLVMAASGTDDWIGRNGDVALRYGKDFGLEIEGGGNESA